MHQDLTAEGAHKVDIWHTPKIRQCHHCSTDYEVSVDLAGQNSQGVITVWREFGFGTNDAMIHSGLGQIHPPAIPRRPNLDAGRIRKRFEHGRDEWDDDVEKHFKNVKNWRFLERRGFENGEIDDDEKDEKDDTSSNNRPINNNTDPDDTIDFKNYDCERNYKYTLEESKDYCEGYPFGYYGAPAEYGPDGYEADDINEVGGEDLGCEGRRELRLWRAGFDRGEDGDGGERKVEGGNCH